jgi:hypothetical protein
MNRDILIDAVKSGILSLVLEKVLKTVLPNNIFAQVFLSGTLFYLLMNYNEPITNLDFYTKKSPFTNLD